MIQWTATTNGHTSTTTQSVNVVHDVIADNPACCPIGTNVIIGTNGNDTIAGTSGRDCILGLAGNDTINGFRGDDIILGGAGQDTIDGSLGHDVVNGGPDFDICAPDPADDPHLSCP